MYKSIKAKDIRVYSAAHHLQLLIKNIFRPWKLSMLVTWLYCLKFEPDSQSVVKKEKLGT